MRTLLWLPFMFFASNACEIEYESYLECLKNQYQNQASVSLMLFEREYRKSLQAQAERCNDPYCKLNFRFFSKPPFTNNGDCFLCDDLGNFIEENLLAGNRSSRLCANERIIEITKRETDSCLNEKLGYNFTLAYFPDFDENFDNSASVVREIRSSTEGFLAVSQQIDRCRQRSKTISNVAHECWIDQKAVKVDRPRHCAYAHKCMLGVSQECRAEVRTISSAFCGCITDRRRALMERAKNIITEVQQNATNPEECIEAVAEKLQTEKVDWVREMMHIMDVCPLPNRRQVGLPKLIQLGCRYAYFSDDWSHLEAGIYLVANFFEALWSRYIRFCPCDV